MKIKIFSDSDTITLTKDELQALVDEAYEEGRKNTVLYYAPTQTPPTSSGYFVEQPSVVLC